MATSLTEKTILITGAARRVGKANALAAAKTGANIILHFHQSEEAAHETKQEIKRLGVRCDLLQADLLNRTEASNLIEKAIAIAPLYALINNASAYQPIGFSDTTLDIWDRHMEIHTTVPMLLSQDFAKHVGEREAKIINMLDWEALRPNSRRFAYSVSKAAMTALTKSLARALAPNITVNGLALGAILEPSEGELDEGNDLLSKIPANRWGELSEVSEAFLFLLTAPAYITGEILHVDGGRNLV